MPKPKYLKEADARKVLDQYVFARDPRHAEQVPQNVDPAFVPKYLQEVVIDKLPPERAWRIRDVMDTYDTRDSMSLLDQYLDRKESKPEPFDRSVCCVWTMAEIGREDRQKQAADYYGYLLHHRLARGDFRNLIGCYAALLPDQQPESPEQPIAKLMEQLEPKAKTDYEADVELDELDSLRYNELPQVARAAQHKQRLAKIDDPLRRDSELVRFYLGLDTDNSPYIDRWVVRFLRRDGKADAKTVVKSFRDVMPGRYFKPRDASDERYLRVRALRAIDYFEGTLTADETKLLKENDRREPPSPLGWYVAAQT
jgi:hypothetical protein